MSLRVIFMGTPDFSVPVLRAIHDAGHAVVCVYSQPPRAGGRRGMETVKTPVHKAADELGIGVRNPLNFKDSDDIAAFADLGADVAVVVAYGLLLPQVILDAPQFGCLNGHASLLPRWRGAAPIQRAIMAGDEETGMMVMQMEAGLDTGPVGLTETRTIGPNTTAGELHDQLMQDGANLMVEALANLEDGTLTFTPQMEDGAVYAKKIDKAETRIDWNASAADVHNHIRGLSPFPGAWCEMELGGKLQRVKVLESRLFETSKQQVAGTVLDDQLTIACATGTVRLTKVQKAGKQAMGAEDFQRGTPLTAGTVLI